MEILGLLVTFVVKEVISRVFGYLFNEVPDREANDNLEASLERQMEHPDQELEIRMMQQAHKMGMMKVEIENSRLVAENKELKRQKMVAQPGELMLRNLGKCRKANREKLGIDNVNKFNYAITGHTGVGKSSFVNALRGLEPNSPESAQTDVVECTERPTPYRHPKFSNLILWDLPGAGTQKHPVETYYEDKALHAFDAIFIITDNRILSIDMEIARQSKKYNKPVVFVRSKADRCIRDLAEENNIPMAEAAAIFRKKVCENFQQELGRAGLSDISIFIVSSRAFLPNKSPYTLHKDTSIEAMDEELVLKFLIETAATRFHNSTERMKNLNCILRTSNRTTGL